MNRSYGKFLRKVAWPVGACFLVAVFLFPITAGRHGIFIDDLRTFNYPNAVFQARCLQKGIIPLWEPHTFAGALPFYTRLDAFAFYLPQWLASLLGESSPGDASYRQLLLIPITIHYLWACLGAYLLGRGGLRLTRPGATMMALTFSLSTSMLAGMFNPPMAVAFSWHPWIAAAVLFYSRFRTTGRLISGSAILALSAPAWPHYTMHGLFLYGLFGMVAVLTCLKNEGRSSAVRLISGLIFMVILSFLLAAPFWWALLEGAGFARETFEMNYDFLTGGPRSVPPRYWATIFIPELFGSTNFARIWGVAEEAKMYWCEATPTRGMLLWLPAVLAVWAVLSRLFKRNRGRPEGDRTAQSGSVTVERNTVTWTWFGLFLVFFSIVLMSGRYTPVLKVLYLACPLFRIPYATRWHTLFTMGLSILTGIGVTGLLTPRSSPATPQRMAGYLVFVTVIALAASTLPLGYWRKMTDSSWFLRVPFLYWAICATVLGLLYIFWRKAPASRIIVILALLGLLRSAWWDAYRPMGVTWTSEQESISGPGESDLFDFSKRTAALSPGPFYRTGYSRVYADIGAVLYGDYSLLGVCVKPMIPRMYHVLYQQCGGWPHDLFVRDPLSPFVSNMSTAHWWGTRDRPPSGSWELVATDPESGLCLYCNPQALPRVFTLDRFKRASEEEQMVALLNQDLRGTIFVDIQDVVTPSLSQENWRPLDSGEEVEHFRFIQERNRITGVDFSDPNGVTIEIEVSISAMLVLTDVWHPGWMAIDNGRPVVVHRVNYLQRGFWLDKGDHKIEMYFRPRAVFSARWFSLIGLLVIAGIIVRGFAGRQPRRAVTS